MERWQYYLGIIKGYEGILSNPSGRVLNQVQSIQGTSFCVVGAIYYEEKVEDYIQS